MPLFRARGWRVLPWCAALLALPPRPLPAAAAEVAAGGPTFVAGDWLGACDELLECRALGFGRGDGQPVLVIDRPRAGTARGAVLLLPGSPAPAVVRLLLPRRSDPVSATPRASGNGGPDSPRRGALSTAETTAVLAVLRGGGRIRFAGPGSRSQRPFAALRLAGAPAVLDWIAERQRRRPEPPPGLRPSPFFDGPRPDVAHPPPEVLAASGVRTCAARADPDAAGARDLSAWRLDAARTLWGVPCGSDNFTRSELFVLAGPGGAVPAIFPTLPQASPAPPGLLDNAEVDPDGRRIDAVDPRRGLGDCGQARSFRWDGERFRLVFAQAMPLCRGLPLREWPVVYRSPR